MSGLADQPKRVRDQVERMHAAVAAVDALLARLGAEGLQRVSASSLAELKAMETTAHNAGMVHVERRFATLATLAERYLARDPGFAAGAWVAAVNEAWLLNRATRRALAEDRLPADMRDLLGEARRTYTVLEAPLEVQPLGASGWVTETGFVGVTVLVATPDDDEPLTLSIARPTMHFGDDPLRLYRTPPAPALDLTLAELAHGAWALTRAKRSADGRLGLHAEVEVAPAPYRGARAYAPWRVEGALDLLDRLRAADADPVRGAQTVYACFAPASGAPLTFDDKHGVARGWVTDAAGRRVGLRVPLRPWTDLLVENLRRLYGPRPDGPAPPRPEALFGRAFVGDGQLLFEPMTALYPAGVALGTRRVDEVHLGLEPLKRVRGAQ